MALAAEQLCCSVTDLCYLNAAQPDTTPVLHPNCGADVYWHNARAIRAKLLVDTLGTYIPRGNQFCLNHRFLNQPLRHTEANPTTSGSQAQHPRRPQQLRNQLTQGSAESQAGQSIMQAVEKALQVYGLTDLTANDIPQDGTGKF